MFVPKFWAQTKMMLYYTYPTVIGLPACYFGARLLTQSKTDLLSTTNKLFGVGRPQTPRG